MLNNIILPALDKLRKKDSFVKKESFITDILFNDIISVPTTKFLAKLRVITPNYITILAAIVSAISVYYYFLGGKENLILGAFFFYLSSLFDGIDGKLARLTKSSSKFGAILDDVTDKAKKALALLALSYSTSSDMQSFAFTLGLVLIHYAILHINYRKNMKFINNCNKYGIASCFEPIDAMFFLLIVGPLFNHFLLGLIITIIFQISKILFHIISTRKVS